MGDTGNALLSAIAISAALYHRDLTGHGQEVSTSIVNAGLLHTSYAWIDADGAPSDWGHVDAGQYGLNLWYRLFECSDDTWIFVAATSVDEQGRLMDALRIDPAVRADAAALQATLESELRSQTAAAWFDLLDGAAVPAEVVDEQFCRDLFDDEHARSTKLISETWSGSVGRFEDPGLLITFSETPGTIQRGPSMCGEHTRVILGEMGYDDDEIAALIADKAVLDAPVVRA
jgi:crotonobetainyl-CoA:carnitine CoA-transferase CaiB-like acyl-CoA transferase